MMMKHRYRNSLTGLALVLSLAVSVGAQAATLSDANILSIFDQANMADITTARLGLKKAHSADVKELAKMVLGDHVAVQQMGRDLAVKIATPCLPPDNDTAIEAQAKAYGELQAKSGAEFDRAYLLHEISFHQGVIDAIKGTLLPSITNPELKALMTKVLPGFEHHLAETKRVAAKLGVK